MEIGATRTRKTDDRAVNAGKDRPTASRRVAIERLRAALSASPPGPILLTGEHGSGKSWLVDRVIDALDAGRRTVHVALSPALDEADFLGLVGHALGLAAPRAIGLARRAIEQALKDESADGRGWLLVIDDVERSSPTTADAIRALAHRPSEQAGFAGIVLVGATEAIRFLADRRRRGLASMIVDHVHLLPLDFDEALELLGKDGELDQATRGRLQKLHRDARGNARALHTLYARDLFLDARPLGSERASSPSVLAPVPVVPIAEIATRPLPVRPSTAGLEQHEALLPSRPPIRVEEDLVEVGWEGEIDSGDEPIVSVTQPAPTRDEMERTPNREEPIEDPYASIQAWTEWSRNQELTAPEHPAPSTRQVSPVDDTWGQEEPSAVEVEGADPVGSAPEPARTARGSHRAETRHDIPPYSRLFGAPRRP